MRIACAFIRSLVGWLDGRSSHLIYGAGCFEATQPLAISRNKERDREREIYTQREERREREREREERKTGRKDRKEERGRKERENELRQSSFSFFPISEGKNERVLRRIAATHRDYVV